MANISLTFPDSTYSTSNKPSADTLKIDIAAIEAGYNAHDTSTTEHGATGAVVGTTNSQTLTNKVISGASNTLSALSAAWPIGSAFLSVVATSPSALLGFGTWVRIAEGQMLIGQKSTDTDFDTAEETGGAKTVSIAEANLPAHVHTVDPPITTSSGQSQTHTHTTDLANTGSGSSGTGAWEPGGSAASGSASVDHTHTVNIAQFNSGSVGSGTALSVMNPYFVIYVWKRTA